MNTTKLILMGLVVCSSYSFATPEFAREYNADCTTCHTMVPILNDIGKSFLRNGFRFSSEDTPTLKKIISPKEGESRPIPFSIMLNANYDSQREDVQSKVKLYTGGTITKNISFFGLTKENFGDNKNNQEFFKDYTSILYSQFNFDESKHVIRAGLLSPLTQFGNIKKASADSGLNGHNSNNSSNNDSQRDRSSNSRQSNGRRQSSNQHNSRGNGNGNNGGGNLNYQTSIQNASVGTIKGVEYSYLADNKVMILLSYGESVSKDNQSQSEGNSQRVLNDSDDYQFMGGLQYKSDSGYDISVIYNQYEKNNKENFSILIPIEKSFDKFQLISTAVYRDENTQEDNYYGLESALIYSLSSNDYIRGVVDIGTEDSDESYGLSLSYSKMYKYLLFHITGARKITPEDNENLFLGSVSLLF